MVSIVRQRTAWPRGLLASLSLEVFQSRLSCACSSSEFPASNKEFDHKVLLANLGPAAHLSIPREGGWQCCMPEHFPLTGERGVVVVEEVVAGRSAASCASTACDRCFPLPCRWASSAYHCLVLCVYHIYPWSETWRTIERHSPFLKCWCEMFDPVNGLFPYPFPSFVLSQISSLHRRSWADFCHQ